MYSTICHFVKYNVYGFVIVEVVDAIYCASIVVVMQLWLRPIRSSTIAKRERHNIESTPYVNN